MNIKVGDTVRFLNEVGGGKISKIEKSKNIVYVEDEDGFEVPILSNECVVVGAVSETTNFPRKNIEKIPDTKEIKIEEPKPIAPIETADGDELELQLAFFPDNIKSLNSSEFDCFLVNDSNYYVFYNIINGEGDKRKSVANGIIEPNIQEFIASLNGEELNDWEKLRIQAIAYKTDKIYQTQRAIDFELKLPIVKFFRIHSFVENEYFDEPNMIFELKKESQKEKLKHISTAEIEQSMMEKRRADYDKKPVIKAKQPKTEKIVVDLHISSLLDNTMGMTSGDILKYQLNVFTTTIEENLKNKGEKIVFIHGKGEGILRKEIEKIIKSKYKQLHSQDASFREYGFGATMITIK